MTKPSVEEPNTPPIMGEEALKKVEQYIEEEEGAANRMTGWLAAFLTLVAVVMSVFHLYEIGRAHV